MQKLVASSNSNNTDQKLKTDEKQQIMINEEDSLHYDSPLMKMQQIKQSA